MAALAAVLGGGTHTHYAVREGGHERVRGTLATTDPGETLAALLDALRPHAPRALGLATFGPVDLDPGSPTYGCLRDTPKPGWGGAAFGPGLAAGLGGIRWAVDTDVNAAAFAEAAHGGEATLAYVTVGTGVGVGWVRGGETPRVPDHPEAGHLPGDGEDPFAGVCPFHGGCVEGLVAGPALRARAGGDPAAIADDDPLWDWVARHLGRLVHAIQLLAPVERIVLGGGIPEARPFLAARVEACAAALGGSYRSLAPGSVVAPRLARPGLEGAFHLAKRAQKR